MAVGDHNIEEKRISNEHIPDSPVEEKPDVIHEETVHDAAERGHVATDK
jgi:hypothetical protein